MIGLCMIIKEIRSNPVSNYLTIANTNEAEAQMLILHRFLSNGFKFRTTDGDHNNSSGGFIIYMAFAEEPLVSSNNIPATAR